MQSRLPIPGPSKPRDDERPVLPPIRAWYRDDSPSFSLSGVRSVSIQAPLDQAPRPRIPHLRIHSDPPTMTSPQHVPSPSFPSHSPRHLASARSLPSCPEHMGSTYPQSGRSLSGDCGRSAVRHYRSASPSPYRSTVQLPHLDQTYLRHWDRSPYGPQASPQLPFSSSSQDPHPASPRLDKSPQTPARYECTYCGKAFNRPSSLKTHTNTHTGEKPFMCPHPGCGRAFSVQSNMRRHARVHDTSRTEGGDSSPDDGTEDPPPSR